MTFIVTVPPVCFVLLALTMFFLTPQVPENQKVARPFGAILLTKEDRFVRCLPFLPQYRN